MFALVIVTNKMIIGLHLIVILMTCVSGLTNYQQECVNVCEDQYSFLQYVNLIPGMIWEW